MPADPTPSQSTTSRQNGAHSTGPTTVAGKARSSLNATRHGLSGRTFFLLADEDEADWLHHTALELAMLQPRDALEHAAALAVARATWREIRADRLEAQVLGDLFAAGRLADPAEAAAAKAVAFKALGTLLRYRGRIEREQRQAMQALDALRLRPLRHKPALVPSEPEDAPALPIGGTDDTKPSISQAALPSEPERSPPLNRHQRRALQAIERQQRKLAA